MPRYTLDTNVYIDAFNHPQEEAALDSFLARTAPHVHLSAVVMQELGAGARTTAQAHVLQSDIFAPFARRRRTFGPSVDAFKTCGEILAHLWRRDGVPYAKRRRSLVNDILLALSCREHGIVLVTKDGDFDTLRPFIRGFSHLRPWPPLATRLERGLRAQRSRRQRR
ncbi:MAG: PIN domain-containing protein [Luteitalea sp.]|nr:PIN domain-containing protein [Luteitalea sp.]